MKKKTYYIYHYHDDYNFRGTNPEIITDLTITEATKEFKKREKIKQEGDILEIRKQKSALLGM